MLKANFIKQTLSYALATQDFNYRQCLTVYLKQHGIKMLHSSWCLLYDQNTEIYITLITLVCFISGTTYNISSKETKTIAICQTLTCAQCATWLRTLLAATHSHMLSTERLHVAF